MKTFNELDYFVTYKAKMATNGSHVVLTRLDTGERKTIPYNFVHNNAASQAKMWLESNLHCEVVCYGTAGKNEGYILMVKFEE